MPNPTPPPTLLTPRLHLIRLTSTTPGSQHLQWFHENWSNAAATSWSLRGRTKSLEESRVLMEEQMREGNWFYSIFLRPEGEQEQGLELGEHIGSISLRRPPTGPELPPPSTFEGAPEIGAGTPLSASELLARDERWKSRRLNLRTLGYALFTPFWGKGYATEAGRGVLDAYADAVGEWRSAMKGKDGEEEKGEGERRCFTSRRE